MTAEERSEARRLARAWRTEGMSVTAGAEPRESLQAPVDPPSSVGAPPERALREAQEPLAALGYAPGSADGKCGRRSIEAYRSFLGDAGMDPSDVLTPEAVRALRGMARAAASAVEATALPQAALHRAVQAGDRDGLGGRPCVGARCRWGGWTRMDGADACREPGPRLDGRGALGSRCGRKPARRTGQPLYSWRRPTGIRGSSSY